MVWRMPQTQESKYLIAVSLLASVLLLSVLIYLGLYLHRRKQQARSNFGRFRAKMSSNCTDTRPIRSDIESQSISPERRQRESLQRVTFTKKALRPLDSSKRKWKVVGGKLVSIVVR